MWPEILPILHSLMSHDAKQENIIRQLSSHDYKSDVKDAIWELNRILKSIHILKYTDDPQYRKDIRTALNRGEAYHQLLDEISSVSIRLLIIKTGNIDGGNRHFPIFLSLV